MKMSPMMPSIARLTFTLPAMRRLSMIRSFDWLELVAAKLFTLQDEKPTGAFLGGPTWASVSDRCEGLEVGTGVLTIGTACYIVIQENISIFVKGAFP